MAQISCLDMFLQLAWIYLFAFTQTICKACDSSSPRTKRTISAGSPFLFFCGNTVDGQTPALGMDETP